MSDKVVPLDDAVSVVADGTHLALAGFAITRNAVAAAHALIRAERRDLRVSQVIGGIETDLLAGAGCLAQLTYSGGSLDRFGPLHAVNRAISDGAITVSEYSSLSLTLRFHAAALGLPYVPARSMLGSDLLEPLLTAGEVRIGVDPFEGHPIVQLAPLRPDAAIVHVDVVDADGNAALSGPTWAIRETVFAARTVVVIGEELVPTGSLDPSSVLIPASIVSAVAIAPNGGHPTAVHQCYDYDRAHLEDYAAAAKEGPDGHATYLDKFVLGVRDHAEYFDLVGGGR